MFNNTVALYMSLLWLLRSPTLARTLAWLPHTLPFLPHVQLKHSASINLHAVAKCFPPHLKHLTGSSFTPLRCLPTALTGTLTGTAAGAGCRSAEPPSAVSSACNWAISRAFFSVRLGSARSLRCMLGSFTPMTTRSRSISSTFCRQ